jgi:hypothetical protein
VWEFDMKLGGGETGCGRAGWIKLNEDMVQWWVFVNHGNELFIFHKSQEFFTFGVSIHY